MKTNLRKIALQILGQKYEVFFVLIWVSLAMWFLPAIIAGIFAGNVLWFLPFSIIGGISFFTMIIIYCTAVSSTKKSLRTLERTGKMKYVNELISGNYNISGKVCFSENLMYCKKYHTVIAYDDIVWIYVNIMNGFQRIPVFRTIDGKTFNLDLDDILIKELKLRKTDIMIGFTPENNSLYNKLVKEFKLKRTAM